MDTERSERWVRRSDLPDLYPIPKGTWERWAYTGTGPVYTKVGRVALYKVSDVETWLADHQVDGERL